MISKNRICDITKSWRFFGITIFFYISQDQFFFMQKKKKKKKKKKTDLFFDITKSILWYQKQICLY